MRVGEGQKRGRGHTPVCERDARGGGLCRAPAFPCPICAQTGVGSKGERRGVLRSLSCSTEWGQGVKGWGGVYLLHTALHTPFAHRGGVVQTPHVEGGGNRAPPPSTRGALGGGGTNGGTHRWGPRSKREGACKLCLHAPSPSLHPFSHAALHAKGEGTDSGGKREERAQEEGVFCPRVSNTCRHVVYVLFAVVLFKLCFTVLSYTKDQNSPKAVFKIEWRKNRRGGPDREIFAKSQRLVVTLF